MFNFGWKNGISKITHYFISKRRNLVSASNPGSHQSFIHKITKDTFSNYSTCIQQHLPHQIKSTNKTNHDFYKLLNYTSSINRSFSSFATRKEYFRDFDDDFELKQEENLNESSRAFEQMPYQELYPPTQMPNQEMPNQMIKNDNIKMTNGLENILMSSEFEKTKRRLKEVFVKKDTDVRGLAGSICWRLREHNECNVLASGDYAVNQAVKGITLARNYLRQRQEADLCFQVNHTYRHDRNSSNQLSIRIFKLKEEFRTTSAPEILRVKGDADVHRLSRSIKIALVKSRYCTLQALGPVAVAKAMVAFTWARRLTLPSNNDLECASEFKSIKNANNIDGIASMLCFTIRNKFMLRYITDEFERFAIDRIPFKIMNDVSLSKRFEGIGDLDLPVVKIAATTQPNKAAGTILTHLRYYGGVQLFATGIDANNQCIKTLSVCRNCVIEQDDVDLAFKCMHAPRENTNGDCQLVTWVHLVPYDEHLKSLLQSDSATFRVGNLSDAKDIGTVMASRSPNCKRLECLASGKNAVSRAAVAISHARLLIAKDDLDLIVFPKFENVNIVVDDEMRKTVRMKLEIIFIEKEQVTTDLIGA